MSSTARLPKLVLFALLTWLAQGCSAVMIETPRSTPIPEVRRFGGSIKVFAHQQIVSTNHRYGVGEALAAALPRELEDCATSVSYEQYSGADPVFDFDGYDLAIALTGLELQDDVMVSPAPIAPSSVRVKATFRYRIQARNQDLGEFSEVGSSQREEYYFISTEAKATATHEALEKLLTNLKHRLLNEAISKDL